MRPTTLTLATSALVLLFTACAEDTSTNTAVDDGSTDTLFDAPETETPDYDPTVLGDGTTDPDDGRTDVGTEEPMEPGLDGDYDAEAGAWGGSGGAGSGTCDPEVEDCEPPDIPAGQLTAGEWNDLRHWDFWTDLLAAPEADPEDPDAAVTDWGEMETQWGFYTQHRVAVELVAGDQVLVDVPVELQSPDGDLVWQARTDNLGQAELFPVLHAEQTFPTYGVTALVGDETLYFGDIVPAGGERYVLQSELAVATPEVVDLMFVIDTTGSMGDELAYIQAELEDVITEVTDSAQVELRLSVNFYRDEGDEYVVRAFPFTTDRDEALADLRAQSANGGGDFPEAVHSGLANAIDEHAWSADARARLLFLVLDAPPHGEREIINEIHDVTATAAAQGVRIVPLSGSGIDKPTEFLMRFLDIATGGTYLFLTDHSGIGGDHIEAKPTIGPHEIELLNELLIRVITERIE